MVIDSEMQSTTITFFRFTSLKTKAWAFFNMRNAGVLGDVSGLRFYKLMGSGRGLGFNAWPDWSVYVLLQVWDNEESASAFFERSDFFNNYLEKTTERWTIYLHNIKANGLWDNGNPFEENPKQFDPEGPLVVLTRATIKWRRLIQFWSYVSTSQKPLKYNAGLIYTKGVGEVPIRQMATISFWRNQKALHDFAYGSKAHKGAIQRTKTFDWYKEEMFARFIPYKSQGTWEGKDLLGDAIKATENF